MNLAALRRARGLTQEALAAKLGVSTGAVGNWESGIRKPRYDTLRQLSAVLEVPIDDIKFPTKSHKTKGAVKHAG